MSNSNDEKKPTTDLDKTNVKMEENQNAKIARHGRWSRTIRFLAMVCCVIAVVIQGSKCSEKLILPPVMTHTRFHVNNSLWYPALTVCRDPAFREEVLAKHGLGASPRYTSEWRYFPWGKVTVSQFYEEATYPAQEVILLYGLNGEADNIAIKSAYFFESGLCHTLIPQATTQDVGLDVGYSVLMAHSREHSGNTLSGWHIYVHEPSETWTENKMQTLGRQEALYVEVGEEVHIKISAQEFRQTSVGQTRNCVDHIDGGEVRCAERCRWEQIAGGVCAMPWTPGVDLPECDNYNDTCKLIVNYLKYDQCADDCCGCQASCHVVRYEASPITRKQFPEPMSQIYVFYNSRMVTLMEERPAYDWSTFVADMGGSLGFLLGLSVLGIIGLLEESIGLVTARLPVKAN